jgi:hypothetical protein
MRDKAFCNSPNSRKRVVLSDRSILLLEVTKTERRFCDSADTRRSGKEDEISISGVEETLSWRQLSSFEELNRRIDKGDEYQRILPTQSFMTSRTYLHF